MPMITVVVFVVQPTPRIKAEQSAMNDADDNCGRVCCAAHPPHQGGADLQRPGLLRAGHQSGRQGLLQLLQRRQHRRVGPPQPDFSQVSFPCSDGWVQCHVACLNIAANPPEFFVIIKKSTLEYTFPNDDFFFRIMKIQLFSLFYSPVFRTTSVMNGGGGSSQKDRSA